MPPKSEELLEKVNELLKQEGANVASKKSASELLEEYILPGMMHSKSTLGSLYDYAPRNKSGFVGKLRNKVINKLKRITISTMEKPMIKQQKYNELLYKAIEALVEENKELRSEISK